MIVALAHAEDETGYGGKAVQLGAALRGGFPVPDGVALHVELVAAVAGGAAEAISTCRRAFAEVAGARVAVRSSAVGEDGAGASFAGQHTTRLNVPDPDAMIDAVIEVWASGRQPAALAYRRRLGLDDAPQVAVVLQQMIVPDCAGVLFTRNPVDGADERVIEAAWGLGEAVVGGLVDPDRYRMRRGGEVIERHVGDKDLAIRACAGGHTEEVEVPASHRLRACLDDDRLAALEALAARCEQAFPGAHDIEWAFEDDRLYLLQRRAVTR